MLTASAAQVAVALPGPADATSGLIGGGVMLVGLVLWLPSVVAAANQRRRETGRLFGAPSTGRGCPTSPAPAPKPWGGAR